MREVNFVDTNRLNLIYNLAEKFAKLYENDFPSYVVGLENAKKTLKLTKKELNQIKEIVEW